MVWGDHIFFNTKHAATANRLKSNSRAPENRSDASVAKQIFWWVKCWIGAKSVP